MFVACGLLPAPIRPVFWVGMLCHVTHGGVGISCKMLCLALCDRQSPTSPMDKVLREGHRRIAIDYCLSGTSRRNHSSSDRSARYNSTIRSISTIMFHQIHQHHHVPSLFHHVPSDPSCSIIVPSCSIRSIIVPSCSIRSISTIMFHHVPSDPSAPSCSNITPFNHFLACHRHRRITLI